MEFLVLTGMSGAGKSSASKVLEDMGYHCIDNMPAAFIPMFAEMYTKISGKPSNVAFIIDVRGEIEFHTLFCELDSLKSKGYSCRTVFIDCSDAVLINRYKETRRVHPLVTLKSITMTEAFKLEREMLDEAHRRADYIIDTTGLTVPQLCNKINAILRSGSVREIAVTCMSFGFKYGIAVDADLVFDARCFPNPYYIPELSELTGLDAAVRDYIFSFAKSNEFVSRLCDMLDFLLPLYIEEGKKQLVIAIGCTGGRHRSVAMAEAVNEYLQGKNVNSIVIHRDIQKQKKV